MKLSHVDAAGRARMVDVADKPITVRAAVAEGSIRMSAEAYRLVADQAVAKGDVLAVSEVAGTLAAKRTAELIPLCHPLGLDHVEVDAVLDEALPGVRVRAAARAVGRTGVEMEALTAVSVALLTVYDMVKAIDRGMELERVRLLEKTGGTHGDARRAGGGTAPAGARQRHHRVFHALRHRRRPVGRDLRYRARRGGRSRAGIPPGEDGVELPRQGEEQGRGARLHPSATQHRAAVRARAHDAAIVRS